MDFGAIRERNIKFNTELLKSFGLETPIIPPVAKKNASPKAPKRKAPTSETEKGKRPKKIVKIASEGPVDTSGRRRSSRIAAAKHTAALDADSGSETGSDFEDNSEYETQEDDRPKKVRAKVNVKRSNTDYVGNRLGKRKHNPKTFGAIPGIEVGTWWETRAECSTDAVHAPFVAGIAGSARDGAYSVALSGGYEDDVDLGYAFTYTGSGGRDLKGTKDKPKNLRTAPQSSHQTFDNTMNASLKRSVETKRPVRVVRGYKLNSGFAPQHGYRYDGLYTVEKAWMERGLNPQGYKVCKFAFKRLPGQPSLLATKKIEMSEEEDEASHQEEVEEDISDKEDAVAPDVSKKPDNDVSLAHDETVGDNSAAKENSGDPSIPSDQSKDAEHKGIEGDNSADTPITRASVSTERVDQDDNLDN